MAAQLDCEPAVTVATGGWCGSLGFNLELLPKTYNFSQLYLTLLTQMGHGGTYCCSKASAIRTMRVALEQHGISPAIELPQVRYDAIIWIGQ